MLKRILWWAGRQDLQTKNFKEDSLLLLCRFILERQKFTGAKSKLVRIVFGTMLDENLDKTHYLLNLISCLLTCNDLWWLQNARHGLCLQLRILKPVSRGARISDEKKQDYTHRGDEFIFHEYNLWYGTASKHSRKKRKQKCMFGADREFLLPPRSCTREFFYN